MSEQRGAKEADHGDDYVNTILFTAGTALVMSYLKRAAMALLVVSSQWRIWVFLFLNLVLLAIALSSARSSNNNNNNNKSSSEENQESVSKCVTAAKEETEEEQCVWFEVENQAVEENRQEGDEDCEMRKKSAGECCDGYEPPRLSKEELNERADAFIMMFRQHLISDATNGGSNHKRESIRVSKHAQVQLLQVHG